jgi:Tfp pilus assembly protein PilF
VTRRRSWILVGATALAVVIELVALSGWWGWRRATARLTDDPAAGARLLATSVWCRLPTVERRGRRLPAGDLRRAPDDLVAAALLGLSRAQIQWAPADPHGFANRARALLLEGELEAAAEELSRALARDPRSPALHRLSALAEDLRGRRPAALDHLATSQAIEPGSGLGTIELTDEEEAWVRLEGLRRGLALYPRMKGQVVISLARELRRQGDADDGRRRLEEEAADPRVVLELARWDLDDDRPSEADRRLEELAERRQLPASILSQTWALEATVRDRLGDSAGAVEAAETALSYDPTSAGPYRVLAGLAERRGEPDAALEHLRRAWGMNPTDVNLLLTVAATAERVGAFDDARLALVRAATVKPDEPALRARLVEFHLRRGELMPATLALSDALDRFPADPQLLRLADRLRAEVAARPPR